MNHIADALLVARDANADCQRAVAEVEKATERTCAWSMALASQIRRLAASYRVFRGEDESLL